MSTTTETTQTYDVSTGNWKAGVLGGIAGSAVMGALILVMNTATLAVAIPSLYGSRRRRAQRLASSSTSPMGP